MKDNSLLKSKYSIRCNLFRDLIGKDSQRGVTLSYALLANQLGHFSLGFIPSILLNIIIENPFCSAIWVISMWTVFEVFNFSFQAYKTKTNIFDLFGGAWNQIGTFFSLNKYKSHPNNNDYFKFNSWNVIGDTILDVFYFAFGAVCAYVVMRGWTCFIEYPKFSVFLIVSIFYGLCWFWWWYRKKIYLQNARFPSQDRLANWDRRRNLQRDNESINEPFKTKINGLFELLVKVENGEEKFEEINNIFIGGPSGIGKTSLAVSIGTEIILNFNKRVGYLTYINFLETYCVEKTTESSNKETKLKELLEIYEVLIIDDINAGCFLRINSEKIYFKTPSSLMKFVQPIFQEAKILDQLKAKLFIFIVGTDDENGLLEHKDALLEGLNNTNNGRYKLSSKKTGDVIVVFNNHKNNT